MEQYDLTSIDDRLAIAAQVFRYPPTAHERKHGPTGYKTYESYRDWLRDEFSFRCVFSLVREQWLGRTGNFDIDHFAPRSERPDLTNEYDNLLYLAHRTNLVRNKSALPDPCGIALGECLYVIPAGDRIGEIESLNEIGAQVIQILRLDSEDATGFRRRILGTIRSHAEHDPQQFREWVGFPAELPDLSESKRRNSENTRPEGVKKSALRLRENGQLSDWY